jgi:hypothetical protein
MATNSATAEAREKISAYYESFEFQENFEVCNAKKTIKFFLIGLHQPVDGVTNPKYKL